MSQSKLSGFVCFSLLAWALAGCGSAKREIVRPQTRVLPVHEITEYSQATAPEIYLRTVEDVLPGGMAAAMVPVLVDWDQSKPFAPDGGYVIRNLNAGGNPLGGTTVLRSARIPSARIERAEFVLVPLDALGVVAHGMLRFVFEDDSPGHLLSPEGDEMGSGAQLGDLVLSWEAWRAPGVDFDFIKGLDPETFGLSLRAYSGPQRFLEDALGERGWECYELRLPGGQRGLQELLYDTLVLGDGTGRHVLAEIFSRDVEEWLSQAPERGEDPELPRRRWEELMAVVEDFEQPEDTRLELAEDERNYQTLLRSCATMALYCVNVATERLLQEGLGGGDGIRPTEPAVMGPVADWMKDMAHMTAMEMFLVAPEAVSYLSKHSTVVPSNIPDALKEVGLLAASGGAVSYALDGDTPYGDLGGILIR